MILNTEWKEIDTLPPVAKEKKIKEISKLGADEDYTVSIMRIQIARQVNEPAQLAELKQPYEMAKQQIAAAKAQLATLPAEQKETMEKQMNLSLKMMKMMVD